MKVGGELNNDTTILTRLRHRDPGGNFTEIFARVQLPVYRQADAPILNKNKKHTELIRIQT